MIANEVKISCVIPTCDRPEILLGAIRSVLGQTLKPAEIIVVNNGKDRITLSAEFENVATVHHIIPYAGVAQARNFGATVAKHEFVAFLDDDDLWPADYLEKAAAVINEGAKCVVSRQDVIVDGVQKQWKNPHGRLTVDHILVRNPGTGGPNIVIERELFFQAKGFDPKLPPSEDKALILELLLKGIPVVALADNYVIVGKDRGEFYLTSYARLAEGVFQFTRKYRRLMNGRQYLYNWSKILYFRYRAGRKWLWPLVKTLHIISKFFPPSY